MARVYFWHPKYDDYPVVGVNWHQANAFCVWRTIRKANYWNQIGLPNTEDFRLPTEYEWEYAARGNRIGNKYAWGGPYTRNSKGCMMANFKPLRGNYGADGGVYPVRADSYFPNDFGLYNMNGNVSEWTWTDYQVANNAIVHDLNGQNYRRVPERGPGSEVPVTLKRKVIRGGSWKDVAYFIENGARTYEYQDTSKCYVGFRCVQTYIGRSNRDKK
jgi:gliding motility-associated lipoprotein GldK